MDYMTMSDIFMDYVLVIFLLISFIPGIWLATRKNFLRIPNEKYDIFPIRLFPAPVIACFVILISYLLHVIVAKRIFFGYSEEFLNCFMLIECLAFSFITIFFLSEYVIRNDLPPEKDPEFLEYALYVYNPLVKIKSNDVSKTKCLEFLTKPDVFNIYSTYKYHFESYRNFDIGRYLTNKEDIEKTDIFLTDMGELFFSQRAVEVFQEYNIHDFYIKSLEIKGINPEIKFYWILPSNIMPEMFPPTSFQTKTLIDEKTGIKFKALIIVDDLIYYDQEAISSACHFNISKESIMDSPYPHNLWHLPIVSNKAMKIFINEFGQHKDDFIPVHCSENSGMISDFRTNDDVANFSENLQGVSHETGQ